MLVRIFFVAICITALLCSRVNAATISVPGSQPNLASAVTAAASGDTIEFTQAGAYGGATIIGKSLTLRSVAAGSVTLDGRIRISNNGSPVSVTFTDLTISGGSAQEAIIIESTGTAKTVVFTRCLIDLGPTDDSGNGRTGILTLSRPDNATNVVTLDLTSSTVQGSKYGILAFGSANITIEDSIFRANASYNLDAAGGTGLVTLRRSRFEGGNNLGPQFHINPANSAGLVNATVENCLFVSPNYGNFQMDGNGVVTFNHCTFVNTGAGLHHTYRSSSGTGSMTVRNSIYSGAAFAHIWSGVSVNNLFESGPQTYAGGTTAGPGDQVVDNVGFVGSGVEPYALAASSPAINAAESSTGVVVVDLLKRPRVGVADLGAFEYQSPSAVNAARNWRLY